MLITHSRDKLEQLGREIKLRDRERTGASDILEPANNTKADFTVVCLL